MVIKETMEVLKALEVIGVAAKIIAKDGVSMADLPEAIELLRHIDTFIEAVKGASLIGAELKDIDQAELLTLGTEVFSLVQKIIKA